MKPLLPLVAAALAGLSCARANAGTAARGGEPAAAQKTVTGEVPKILKLPRPAGGEWLGLYILGKKAGYAFIDLKEGELDGTPAIHATSVVSIAAEVGGTPTQRTIRDERFYERKDGGRLLGFRIEHAGDGGNEVLVGRCTPKEIALTRKRPGKKDEQRTLAPSKEVLEEADAPREVAVTRERREGLSLDAEDSLEDKKVTTEFVGEGTYVKAGLTIPVLKVRTIEEKNNVPVEVTFDREGRTLEINFGQVMVGKAEDQGTAQRLDKVDLFALTRVVLDRPLPPGIRTAPAALTLRVAGLAEHFQKDTYRQRYEKQEDGSVRLTIRARPPTSRATRPVAADGKEDLAEALKATLNVESDAKAIVELAAKVVGGEKDARKAALKLSRSVYLLLQKSYGSSSDRATDVLLRKKGDCTEHSLLLTALARAAGIPARRVDGLVYMEAGDGVPALYWHEWVEVYVGEWTPLDPTFDQAVADPTHIALGGEGRSDAAGLIGQLKISVVAVKPEASDAPAR